MELHLQWAFWQTNKPRKNNIQNNRNNCSIASDIDIGFAAHPSDIIVNNN